MTDKDTAESQARAQYESIARMVAALNVDYGRLEELREKRSAGCWVAGWNMPGYIHDSEPATFDDDESARDYLIEEIERAADDHGNADCETGEYDEGAKIYEDALPYMRSQSGEFSQQIGAYVWWVTFTPDALADSEEYEELAELESAAGDCSDEDEASEAILNDALSVEVRSGWGNPGGEMTAEEFRLVLCTGGPHVEIVGELDRCTPTRARILYRDWGTSGELFDFDPATVLTYCQQFCFGE